MKTFKCCICGKETSEYGNNPWPIEPIEEHEERCCDFCNSIFVIPLRMAIFEARRAAEEPAE